MKIKNLLIASAILLISVSSFAQKAKKGMATKTDSISYVLGLEVAGYYLSQEIEINAEQFNQGFSDALKKSPVIDEATKGKIIQQFQMEQQAKQKAKSAGKSSENIAKGKAFLEANKKNPDVKVTPSGLQYKVVKEGIGEHPKATDKVKVHYHGTLIDGTVFDSSVERGEPISFGLNQVIPGWTEGVQLMTPGSKYIFYIPSNLAYGDRDAGKITAGSTLIFEVELFEINPK